MVEPMGWLWLVGSFKTWVSFAEYCLLYRALLQKRPIILGSLLIVATSYLVGRWICDLQNEQDSWMCHATHMNGTCGKYEHDGRARDVGWDLCDVYLYVQHFPSVCLTCNRPIQKCGMTHAYVCTCVCTREPKVLARYLRFAKHVALYVHWMWSTHTAPHTLRHTHCTTHTAPHTMNDTRCTTHTAPQIAKYTATLQHRSWARNLRCAQHTYGCVMPHIRMGHGIHMNASCHTYEWVMSYIWMRRVTDLKNGSRHGYQDVMSHIQMHLVTHIVKEYISNGDAWQGTADCR